jgi:DNA ligase 1
MTELKELSEFVNEVKSVSSQLQKIIICKKHASIKKLLSLIYDPYICFKVSIKGYKKYTSQYRNANKENVFSQSNIPLSLKELLVNLSSYLSGHDSYNAIYNFIQIHKPYENLILDAINKDLKVKIGRQILNKAFPNLINQFNCALAFDINHEIKFFDENKGKWKISRKYDGIRVLTMCENGLVKFYSRNGNVFPDHNIKELLPFKQSFENVKCDCVFDGEMVIIDTLTGKEQFNLTNSILSSKAVKKETTKILPHQKLYYYVFDFIPLDIFLKGMGNPVWSIRQKMLVEFLPIGNENIQLLEQFDQSQHEQLWKTVMEQKWEGLIHRLDDSLYFGKRHKSILKEKVLEEDEFIIKDATVSQQMNPKTNELVDALEHVRIDFEGNSVWVGNGFSWDEKLKYGQYPRKIIGKYITVAYNGITKNANGQFSLRHPRKKEIYNGQRFT